MTGRRAIGYIRILRFCWVQEVSERYDKLLEGEQKPKAAASLEIAEAPEGEATHVEFVRAARGRIRAPARRGRRA